jgi:intein/homing endonuclease
MKIHLICDSFKTNSGFGIVGKHLALGLKKLGYNVSATGIQTSYLPEYYEGIKIYPLATDKPEDTQLANNLLEENPDIIIYIGDLYTDISILLKIPLQLGKKIIVHCPVEGIRIPKRMVNDLKEIVEKGGKIIPQSMYGKKEMEKHRIKTEKYSYHGYDPNIFKKLDLKGKDKDYLNYCYYDTEIGKMISDPDQLDKNGCYCCNDIYKSLNDKKNCPYHKEEEFIFLKWYDNVKENGARWTELVVNPNHLVNLFKGRFIFTFIGANISFRKRPERLLEAYAKLIEESKMMKDRVWLHMHTVPNGTTGFDLLEIADDLGIKENVSFSYGMTRSNTLSDELINILLNVSDCFVSGTSSEGMCVLPDTSILTLGRGVQKIKDIKIGDKVLTHKGRFMRVNNVTNREYNGDMIKITPHKLRVPIILTPEHRILAIKTKMCQSNYNSFTRNGKRICKPGKCYVKNEYGLERKYCKYIIGEEPWRKYITEWIESRNLEKGDFVLYPRPNENEADIEYIKIRDYIDDFLNVIGGEYNDNTKQSDLFGSFIEDTICMDASYARKHAKIPAKIKLDGDLMRLFGYFIAEGDIAGDRQIEFSFHIDETEYHKDVERIMKEKFGLETEHIDNKRTKDGEKINAHILRYSNTVLSNMFQNMFCPKEYVTRKGPGSKAYIVRIPSEFLNLPLDKLKELIKGEWRGDGGKGTIGTKGYNISTTSETLAHQLVYLLSKFNILASLRFRDEENRHRSYNIDIVGENIDIFEKIIEEKHQFRDRHYDHASSSKYIKGNNFYYIPIDNIDIIRYNGYVYDISIEEDSSFVCPIVIHNSINHLLSMAVGLPCVSPNNTVLTELLGNDTGKTKNRGLLARIESEYMLPDLSKRSLVDIKDLSIKMKEIYLDKQLRSKFSENAIKFVSNYSWDKIVQEFDQIIKS